ncbi:MAG: amidase family protein, partial [Hyphomicrobium sp.]
FRRQFAEAMNKIFADVDIILAPSTPMSAPLLGQKTMMLGDREVPLRPNIGIFTQPISFIGLPVAAVPVRESEGMPFGVQVISRPWREDLCLRVARVVEAAGLFRARTAG